MLTGDTGYLKDKFMKIQLKDEFQRSDNCCNWSEQFINT